MRRSGAGKVGDDMRKPRASSDPRARAKVWTPERIAAVCELVAEGTFVAHACAECGGSYTGLWDVMQADPDVRQQIDAARAKGVRVLRERLDTATTDWKREAWLLERYDREAFAPPKATVEQEISGRGGGPVQMVALTPEQARAELESRLASMTPAQREAAAKLLGDE